jgi:hypothetical protein
MLKPVPFQAPTKHGSKPVSGAASDTADASGAAVAGGAAEVAGAGASVGLGALLQAVVTPHESAQATSATTEGVLCMALL